jgi:hypothetical protein
MVELSDARRLALALPEAHEAPHHEISSFRVEQKIFATVPDGEHLNVMLGPDETERAVASAPAACEELWWGKSLAGVRVTLARIEPGLLAELLAQAWRRRAPRRLLAKLDAEQP